MQKCVLEKVISGKVGLIDLLVSKCCNFKVQQHNLYNIYIDKSRHGYRK